MKLFCFLELLYCVSQSCPVPLQECFKTESLLEGPQFQMSCLCPGHRLHAQKRLICLQALKKECKIKSKVLKVGFKYFDVFSQVGYAGTVIPIMGKTPAS